ncbi:hypothetical protein SAMN05192574_105150 [Mucilaginibacter gossypiicola]|uniref:Uncharacterized protein n=1 Tax=Mucilaginibacter gossypiicola TaxID=551995 RepID=A0A1H8LL91_9SPHI|nr:hypothetical protein [Mucilaginibacter gossypiicola]SEO05914.1 hypothetical protein SAMN05192574_105150 [Mucilaginibacter gossypiicola]
MAYQEITTIDPLYISITDSRDGVDDYQLELQASADYLNCGKDCVWLRLFHIDTALPKATKENLAARKQWMIDNEGLLKGHVKAIVNVVDDPFYEQAKKIKIEKAYGVCGTCCKTLSEALDWIVSNVSLAGIAEIEKQEVLEKVSMLNN